MGVCGLFGFLCSGFLLAIYSFFSCVLSRIRPLRLLPLFSSRSISTGRGECLCDLPLFPEFFKVKLLCALFGAYPVLATWLRVGTLRETQVFWRF